MSTHTQQTICTESCESERDRDKGMPRRVSQAVTREDRSVAETVDSSGGGPLAIIPAGRSVDWSDSVDGGQSEEDIMQISGKGHWFLEGWIGDHAVDFLVDSGSAVTAVSRSFFNRLSEAGAPVGPERGHRLARCDRRVGDCVERMGHRSRSPVVLIVWCRSWDCERGSIFWFVT